MHPSFLAVYPTGFESDLGFAVVRFLYLAALVVWIGGMVTLLFVVAPTAFGQLDRAMAGALNGHILRRFDVLIYACIIVVIGAASLRAIFFDTRTLASVLRYALIAVMAGLALYSGTALSSEIQRARPAGAGAEARNRFARLHRRSVRIYATNMILGAILLFLS